MSRVNSLTSCLLYGVIGDSGVNGSSPTGSPRSTMAPDCGAASVKSTSASWISAGISRAAWPAALTKLSLLKVPEGTDRVGHVGDSTTSGDACSVSVINRDFLAVCVSGMYVPSVADFGTFESSDGEELRCDLVEVAERIGRANTSLTPAERRVAEVVLEQPQLVAFGTVADLAEAAASGAATVVRLAGKLGFDGFTGLQASVQHTLAGQLRPAAERIREPAATDAIGRHLQLEIDNVATTLRALNGEVLADVVAHLAAHGARVFVVSGDASLGVAQQLVADLHALRDDVTLVDGNDVAVRRTVAQLRPTDVVVTIDLRRYDRWVVDAARDAHSRGVWCVSLTDSLLSPLAGLAERTLTVAAAGGGPFDSHVGTLALINVLVAGVADRLRREATERLDRAEAAWQAAGALTDR